MPSWKQARSTLLMIWQSVSKELGGKTGKGAVFEAGTAPWHWARAAVLTAPGGWKSGVSAASPLPRVKPTWPSFLHLDKLQLSRSAAGAPQQSWTCLTLSVLVAHGGWAAGAAPATPEPRDAHPLPKEKGEEKADV